MLSFEQLRKAHASREKRWHHPGVEEWSLNDWLVGLGGECGEALNEGKKIRRIESGMQQHGDVPPTLTAAKEKLMLELADIIHYVDLVAMKLGLSLEDAVIEKFNQISEREGFPERLGTNETGDPSMNTPTSNCYECDRKFQHNPIVVEFTKGVSIGSESIKMEFCSRRCQEEAWGRSYTPEQKEK